MIRLCMPRHSILQRQWRCLRQYSSSEQQSKDIISDDLVNSLALQPQHSLTLSDLVKHGKPPLSSDQLLDSANFTLSILPSRLAQRIRELRNLPYIVVTNPQIAQIHGNYMHSLCALLPWAEHKITTAGQEQEFTQVISELVDTHANTIPTLARGFLESRKYVSPAVVARFLDQHLRARIGTRLIAEQHIALHYASQPQHESVEPNGSGEAASSIIGVVDTMLSPAALIQHCESVVGDICEFKYGERPQITLSGEQDFTFAQIPVHLEYILTELLKNSFRATIENRTNHEPIEVTIAPMAGAGSNGKDNSNGKMGNAKSGVTIRIRDRGGGISPENYAHIWDYSFTTFDEEEIQSVLSADNDDGSIPVDGLSMISGSGGSSLAGLGYGLPLSRAYAEHFGGGVAVQSLWGWGTDVYLTLKGVDKIDK